MKGWECPGGLQAYVSVSIDDTLSDPDATGILKRALTDHPRIYGSL
jgi:hypothetical protein